MSGYRLPPPPGCPKPMYKLMMQCWYVLTITGCVVPLLYKMVIIIQKIFCQNQLKLSTQYKDINMYQKM